MSHRTLEMGISAIQNNSLAEGARLLRIALKSGELAPPMRAIAYLWLAETQTETQQKRASYAEALAADPANAEAQQRLTKLLTAELPAVPQTAAAQGGINIAEHLAHIVAGPNGAGTAFFVAQEGILATTRYVVGGLQQVTVELHNGKQLTGKVVRAHIDLDLTLIRVDHNPGSLLPVTSQTRIAEEAPLTAVTYDGETIRTTERPTHRVLADHWIPTTATRLIDAGGNPIFDEKNYVVGMMTKNTSRTSAHLFGLHIAAILRAVEAFGREARAAVRIYCPECGNNSAALGAGFYYCDQCGSVTPAARAMARAPIPGEEAYYETGRVQCTACGSFAGIYRDACLRCGEIQQTQGT
jgi:hypothetical protein